MVVDQEAKKRIYTTLLKQSPPGEFNAVFDDLRTMHDDVPLLDEQCDTTLVEYNHDNFIPIQHLGLKDTLITKYNLLDAEENLYIEPNTNKAFIFDHINRNVLEVRPNTHHYDSELLAWRAAIQKELDAYIADHFHKHGVGAAFIHDGNIIMCIGAHKYQRRNCYNCRWSSYWVIPSFTTKRTTHAINGHISVLTHYYEEGNVQMNSKKNFSLNVAYQPDMASAAKEILKNICDAENSYLANMQEKFSNLSDKTFKSLRRTLPVTRTKMDWLKVYSYRVTKDITNPPSQA